MNRIRLLASTIGALALTWLGLAIAAPAAFALQVPPGGGGGPAVPATATVTRAIVVGGMRGWQIALITIAAALVAAALAVLADRARAARRLTVPSAA